MKLCLRCNQYFEDGIELCPIDTSHLESVGDHPLIGALINDRYVVDSVIGKGSSGIVYKATRLLMGREVAVKVLHSYLGAESGALDRFLREARAASRLRHPHIINIWESGVTDDAQPYFVMDYLEGMTLADLIHEKGYIHIGRAMPIVTQVCEALAEAHKHDIVHRDIKPENIVLQANEGDNNFDDYVKVLDFGIADQTTSLPGQIRQRTAAGSPAYMSPEQCQGFELDHRSDIYSLAIVIFEMLTGSRPFIADDVMKLFYMHVQQPPPTLSSVRADLKFNPHIEAVIARALAKKPAGRQQSIKEFQKELEDAFNNLDVTPVPAATKGAESVTVDLFSVPVSDRLMDGGKTGNHNFLPGPEDWAEPQPESLPNKPVYAAPTAAAAVPKGDSPDVSAAVGRLLKSARRASEALKRDSSDVRDWAKVAPNTEVAAGLPANQSPPGNAQAPVLPGQDKPEVANWAEKVRNRPPGVSSQDLPEYNPGQSTLENLAARTSPSENAAVNLAPAPAVPSLAGPEAGATMDKFARITKPSDFLKAKSAEARQATEQGNEGEAGAPKVVASSQSSSPNAQEPAENNQNEAAKREGFLRSRPQSLGPATQRPDESRNPAEQPARPPIAHAEEAMPAEENNKAAKPDMVSQPQPKAKPDDAPGAATRPSQTAPISASGRPGTPSPGTPAPRPAGTSAPGTPAQTAGATHPAGARPASLNQPATRPAAPPAASGPTKPAVSSTAPTAPQGASPVPSNRPAAPTARPPAPGSGPEPRPPAPGSGPAPRPAGPTSGPAPRPTGPASGPAPRPGTAPASGPATRPATAPASEPATRPATAPASGPATRPATPPASGPTPPPAGPKQQSIVDAASRLLNSLKKDAPTGSNQAQSELGNLPSSAIPEAQAIKPATTPPGEVTKKLVVPPAGDTTKKLQLPGDLDKKVPPPATDDTAKKSAAPDAGEITKKLLAADEKKAQEK